MQNKFLCIWRQVFLYTETGGLCSQPHKRTLDVAHGSRVAVDKGNCHGPRVGCGVTHLHTYWHIHTFTRIHLHTHWILYINKHAKIEHKMEKLSLFLSLAPDIQRKYLSIRRNGFLHIYRHSPEAHPWCGPCLASSSLWRRTSSLWYAQNENNNTSR